MIKMLIFVNYKSSRNMYIVFDTETTGLPKDFSAPITDFDNWPRIYNSSRKYKDS